MGRPAARGRCWLTAALIGFLTWLQQTYLLRLQVKLSVTTSSRFLWHVLRLPVQFFSQRYAGEIGSRVALNDIVATLLSGQLATTVITMLTLVFYLVMMAALLRSRSRWSASSSRPSTSWRCAWSPAGASTPTGACSRSTASSSAPPWPACR